MYYSLMYCDPQVLYASPVQKEQSSWGWKICIQPPSVLSVNFEASLQPSERHFASVATKLEGTFPLPSHPIDLSSDEIKVRWYCFL